MWERSRIGLGSVFFQPGKSSLVVFSVGWLPLLSSQDGSSPPLWRACVSNVARQAKLDKGVFALNVCVGLGVCVCA